MLLRFASFLLLILFSFANPAFAETRLDVGAMGSSMNLAPYLQRLATEKPEVLVELPRDATGKVGVIALKSSRSVPSYQWMILTLVNTSKAQKNLIVVIDHQKFAGSRLIYPLHPGKRHCQHCPHGNRGPRQRFRPWDRMLIVLSWNPRPH